MLAIATKFISAAVSAFCPLVSLPSSVFGVAVPVFGATDPVFGATVPVSGATVPVFGAVTLYTSCRQKDFVLHPKTQPF
jgi:hypothetical protein